MSLAKLVFPQLCWAELSQVLSFLSPRELWVLGCCNRTAFITFMREKNFRQSDVYNNPPSRFLSRGSEHQKVGLVSYPRSGNSFLRRLLEDATGIATGSDNQPNRVLAEHLLRFGYQGEGIADNSVWVVKSHFPERLGYLRVPVSRLLLIVRNPFDAIESYFHMCMTNTHHKTLAPQAFRSLQQLWGEFIENEARVWARYHDFWVREANVPLLLVRYEDLLLQKEEVHNTYQKLLYLNCCI
jgi:hypothetical protein